MSIKNLPTLKGVFPLPSKFQIIQSEIYIPICNRFVVEPPPKRDFIRENKQKLRAVQRFSCPRRENSEQDEFSTRRSHVRQPQAPVRSRSIPAHRIPSGCSCASKQTESSMASVQPPSRRRSVNCDKSIQTDDIDDEAFLADALRRWVPERFAWGMI